MNGMKDFQKVCNNSEPNKSGAQILCLISGVHTKSVTSAVTQMISAFSSETTKNEVVEVDCNSTVKTTFFYNYGFGRYLPSHQMKLLKEILGVQ